MWYFLRLKKGGTGLQKDRDHGTAGRKEGLSSIGRFMLKCTKLERLMQCDIGPHCTNIKTWVDKKM